MRILIVSDAWHPQVNGVVRTLDTVAGVLRRLGHHVEVLSPQGRATLPCPTYPEIRLSLFPARPVGMALEGLRADAVHIATEGPLGVAARRQCLARGIPFTTSFHTRFPEYLQARFGVPADWVYPWLRRFHNGGSGTMVATRSLRAELGRRGFRNLLIWSRGVDLAVFRPGPKDFLDLPRPIWLSVGRVAVEKNIESFLRLPLPGSKLVVGDGPQLDELRRRYPTVHFAGARHGAALARYYAASDVFVFPSRTDTFGLVLLEALASGLPVAAYPAQGPRDVIGESGAGVLDEDLLTACQRALAISPDACLAHARRFSWEACAEQFLQNLRALPGDGWAGLAA